MKYQTPSAKRIKFCFHDKRSFQEREHSFSFRASLGFLSMTLLPFPAPETHGFSHQLLPYSQTTADNSSFTEESDTHQSTSLRAANSDPPHPVLHKKSQNQTWFLLCQCTSAWWQLSLEPVFWIGNHVCRMWAGFEFFVWLYKLCHEWLPESLNRCESIEKYHIKYQTSGEHKTVAIVSEGKNRLKCPDVPCASLAQLHCCTTRGP